MITEHISLSCGEIMAKYHGYNFQAPKGPQNARQI